MIYTNNPNIKVFNSNSSMQPIQEVNFRDKKSNTVINFEPSKVKPPTMKDDDKEARSHGHGPRLKIIHNGNGSGEVEIPENYDLDVDDLMEYIKGRGKMAKDLDETLLAVELAVNSRNPYLNFDSSGSPIAQNIAEKSSKNFIRKISDSQGNLDLDKGKEIANARRKRRDGKDYLNKQGKLVKVGGNFI